MVKTIYYFVYYLPKIYFKKIKNMIDMVRRNNQR